MKCTYFRYTECELYSISLTSDASPDAPSDARHTRISMMPRATSHMLISTAKDEDLPSGDPPLLLLLLLLSLLLFSLLLFSLLLFSLLMFSPKSTR